jgi:ATP-dependent DNA ligase
MPLPAGFHPALAEPRNRQLDTWVHEIKHDGFRVIARKDGAR